MSREPLRILQVSLADMAGGAERVAWNLFSSYRERGLVSHLAVGLKKSSDPDVLLAPGVEGRGWWERLWWRLHSGQQRADGVIIDTSLRDRLVRKLASPAATLEQHLGLEDFHHPGSWRLPELPPDPPDIIHCHNLHGGYFDLRVLAQLSQQIPVVLTLHDAWMLSGHCSHSFSCERWETGCGECPDLMIYPAIRRDATAYNWQRKRKIYARSRLYVSTPSQWLMNKVNRSMLAPAIIQSRVIPYGVNLAIFRPVEKAEAKRALDIPQDARVLLFAANRIKQNPWKDYQSMYEATREVAEQMKGSKLIFIALGEDAPPERVGDAQIRFVPFQKELGKVASYYQAADVYLHAAHADTFPNVVLEALACGAPVVATNIGGIPEQIIEGETGFLIPHGNSHMMAARIQQILQDESLRERMSAQAILSAGERFNLERQVDDHLRWYREILEKEGRVGLDD